MTGGSTGSVEVASGRLAYRLDGPRRGPVLVLSSSLGTDAGLWAAQVGPLSAHFLVLRYDHPGHGASVLDPADGRAPSLSAMGTDVLALLDALSIERVCFAGLSLGGMVGTWLGAHAPDRIDRLVLACTGPWLGPAEQWHERAAVVRRDGPGSLAEQLFARWFTPAFAAAQPGTLQQVAAMLSSCQPEGYARCCEAIAAADLRPDLHLVEAPTLVVSGADDPVTPPGTGLALWEGIAGASMVVLAEAAHLANLAQPARFTAAVLDHLTGTPAQRGMAVRRAVLGDEHVDRATRRAGPLNAGFQDLITRYAWGDVWARPGLDRRTRSAVTVAMLVALGRLEELSFHLPAAVRNGMTPEELEEVLLQCAVYAGVPAANAAFARAAEVLDPGRDSTSEDGEGRP